MEIIDLGNWVGEALRQVKHEPWRRKWRHLSYRLAWDLRPIFKSPGKVPLNVDIELCNYCNFRCIFCQQATGWLKKDDHQVMPKEMYREVVDQCVALRVPSIKVNWRGEPMLCKDVAERIRYAKDKGIHEVSMNTNASLLTPEASKEIIQSGLDRIIFSCDGISAEAYNTLRRGGSFETFITNVRVFRGIRDRLQPKGRRRPIIRINAALQPANQDEVPLMKERFRKIADELRINPIYSPLGKIKGIERKKKAKRRGCPQIYQRLVVSAEGDLIPCCVDFLKALKVGNIKHTSLADAYRWWVTLYVRQFHENHEGRSRPSCKTCDNFALSERRDGKILWR
jgi:radical SAM protein with 4Fe4S-binding SPASM domain